MDRTLRGFVLREEAATEFHQAICKRRVDAVAGYIEEAERAGGPVHLRGDVVAPRVAGIEQREIDDRQSWRLDEGTHGNILRLDLVRTIEPLRHDGAVTAAATLTATLGAAIGASAAEPADSGSLTAQNGAQQEVIVTGTRRTERTAADSNVPVDVVTQDDLRRTPAADLNNKLQSLVPSYNVKRLPLSDGAIFVRPASLRSLSPDQTLVLVNGKRWHRSAFVDVTSRGSQAVDLSQIPQVAIKRVEVLRDGASAQYGSDAIAGVINLILEDGSGGDGYAQFGEYSEGDGQNLQAAFRAGFGLGDRGNLNLSLQYGKGDATSRSIQRPQAEALIALGEPYASTVRQPVVQRFGQPDLEDYHFFYNANFDVNDSVEAYAFGNYARSKGVNDFNWRAPAAAAGFATSSAYARSAFQNGANAVFPDWDLHSVFPGGFTPRLAKRYSSTSRRRTPRRTASVSRWAPITFSMITRTRRSSSLMSVGCTRPVCRMRTMGGRRTCALGSRSDRSRCARRGFFSGSVAGRGQRGGAVGHVMSRAGIGLA